MRHGVSVISTDLSLADGNLWCGDVHSSEQQKSTDYLNDAFFVFSFSAKKPKDVAKTAKGTAKQTNVA